MFWRKSASASASASPSAPDVSKILDKAAREFPPRDASERQALLDFINNAPAAHGPWQHFKKLFKLIEASAQANAQADFELLSALLSRVDSLTMQQLKTPGILASSLQSYVPAGAPRARWDAAGNRLIVRTAEGRENELALQGNNQIVQLGDLVAAVGGSWNDAKLYLIGIGTGTPTLLSTIPMKQAYGWQPLLFAARQGHHVLLGLRSSNNYSHIRLHVFDVSEMVAPREVGKLDLGNAYNFQAAVDGERLFFIGGDWNRSQLKVVDLRQPNKPKMGASHNLPNSNWNGYRLAACGGYAYVVVGGGRGSLRIIDGRDAEKLTEVGTLGAPNLTGIAVSGGRVFVKSAPDRVARKAGQLQLVDATTLSKPKLLGAPPKSVTVGYLKRRARRLLWKLAKENPALYIQLTTFLSMSSGSMLDMENGWITTDALLGAGHRFTQRRHGRAGYALTQSRFILKTREERFPALWDAHPEAARALWLMDTVPLAAREMALKILRANKQPVPAVPATRFTEFLTASSPLLQSQTVRAVVEQMRSGGTVDGTSAALALLAAPAPLRRELESWIEKNSRDKKWRAAFGAVLQQAIGTTRPGLENAPWRRRSLAAKLLAGAWDEFLDQGSMIDSLSFWMQIGDAALQERLLTLLRSAGKEPFEKLVGHLRALVRETASLNEAQREQILAAFLEGATGRELTGEQALELINQSEAVARLAWRVMEKVTLQGVFKATVHDALWNAIFRSQIGVEAMQVAFSDPAAIRVFLAAILDRDKLMAWVETNQAIAQYVTVEFFDALLSRLPENQWDRIVFRALAWADGPRADAIWAKYAYLADDFSPKDVDFQRGLFWDYNRSAGDRAWDFLGRSKVSAEMLRRFWETVFRIANWSGVNTAFTHPAAPDLLRRAEFSGEQMSDILKLYSKISERFSPEFFLAVLEIVPGAERLQMLLDASPERWQAARSALLLWLKDAAVRTSFWLGLWEKLKGGADSALQERLLSDSAIVMTFERIAAESFEQFLRTDEPAHEPWLRRWLEVNPPALGDEILMLTATHSIPEVRAWGIARLQKLGLNLAAALRLLEAELPDCVRAGRGYFDSMRRGSADEMDYALALCDSPGYEARKYGREFIEARRKTLFTTQLLANLAQHSSPDMQAWLAAQLLETKEAVPAAQEFDRAVLRARGRAREAKNLVQQRHVEKADTQPVAAPDTATLIEVARGRTRRDADWALRQLAQKALAGEKIEGVELLSENTPAPTTPTPNS